MIFRKHPLGALCASILVAGGLLASAQSALAGPDLVRVVVSYRGGSSAATLDAVSKLGGRVVLDLSELDAVAVSLPRAAVAKLRAAKGVEFVEEDAVRTIQGRPAGRSGATASATSGQTVPYGITMVQADQLSGTPAARKTICIVDSGIDATHEDLVGNTLSGKNYTTSGSWNTDEASHGTHVAGTIAALNNTLGVVGVAGRKQLKLHISKVFDASGSAASSVIAKGISGCTLAKANVITMSLGGSSASSIEKRAVDTAYGKGILLIAAAGNAGTTAISYPAGFPNVMSVAAVDSNMAWATFSQYNADVEISGPGVSVLSTVPLGSQTGGSTTVGSSSYTVQAMAGSPRLSATGPLADFGLGDVVTAGSMTGKVCLISRGNIAFSDKVLNCQSSGGIGAVIYNNTTGDLFGTLNGVATTIPSVGALQADGATMLGQLGQSSTVAVFGTNDLYAYYSGTSMATPHVSAVAALVWSYFPSCTGEQMRTTLKNSALDIGDPGRDDKTGAGLVQARAAYDRISTLGCGM
jgi:subtilisin family serine protease